MPAIVLLSGGLDSCVNLKRACDDTGVSLALTFDYGQRAAAREAAAASLMCQQLAIPHRLVPLPWLREISASSLTDIAAPIPQVSLDQLQEERVVSGETGAAVWIPNRNALFVNIAASFAEALHADTIVAGLNAEEAAAFPDNSAAFVAAANAALTLSTRRPVSLLSYTQEMTKTEIVRLGRQIQAPLACLWSCYEGQTEHCGRCESCARLERALRDAGAWEWFNLNRVTP